MVGVVGLPSAVTVCVSRTAPTSRVMASSSQPAPEPAPPTRLRSGLESPAQATHPPTCPVALGRRDHERLAERCDVVLTVLPGLPVVLDLGHQVVFAHLVPVRSGP